MNFRFPLQSPILGEASMFYGLFRRFCARQMANMFAKLFIYSYHFRGDDLSKGGYCLVDVDKYQIVHRILHTAGYDCTIADIKGRCGVRSDTKTAEPAPEGTLALDREEPIGLISRKSLTDWIARVRVPWLDCEKLK